MNYQGTYPTKVVVVTELPKKPSPNKFERLRAIVRRVINLTVNDPLAPFIRHRNPSEVLA